MFGSKSRKLKSLQLDVEAALAGQSRLQTQIEGMKRIGLQVQSEVVGLREDQDQAREGVAALQAEIHKAQTQVIPALVAERDALVKTNEDLRIQNMELQRTLRQVAENPSDAQAPSALAS